MYETILQEIGLTRNEIKVYLALLEIGRTKTGLLIKETKLHTSKVYSALERLIDKGLVSLSVESGVKHFSAVDPSRIKDYLIQKKEEIEREETEIDKLIPLLRNKQISDKQPKAEIFIGIKGMKTAFEDILKTLKKGEECLVFVLLGSTKEVTAFFDNFHRKRIFAGIKVKIIVSERLSDRIKVLKHLKLTDIKTINSTIATPATFNLYKNKTIVSLGLEKEPVTFLLENKDITDSFRNYFNLLWKLAKP